MVIKILNFIIGMCLSCSLVSYASVSTLRTPSLPASSAQKSNLTPAMVKKFVKIGETAQKEGEAYPASAVFAQAIKLDPHVFEPIDLAAAGLRPRVVKTQLPSADVVIASKILHPLEDSAKDAAPLIQNAIDEIARIGGGVIFLSAGSYRLDGPLTVREGVILRGDWAPLTEETGVRGTVLMPVANRGHPEGPPALTLERGSGIRELTIWYPDQDPTNIVPYPWTVRTSQEVVGNNITILNVTMVNPYQAIRIGSEWNELHYIRNVVATPLRTGIWIDFTTDIGRINNVDLSPRWWEISGLPGAPTTEAEKDSLRDFLKSEAIGVDIGRSDWQYLYQLRVDGYHIGLRFHKKKMGAANAVMFASEIINCGTALLLERLNFAGLSVTGSRFSGQYSLRAPASFTILTSGSGLAQFNTCQFEGEVLLDGSGLLTFQNCSFISWRETAIRADAGRVSLINCDFKMDKGHLKLGPRARRALVLSNRFPGQPDIMDRTEAADIQISHYQLDFARPDISPHNASLMPRPRTDKLFIVTDFGASPEHSDNTQAFQRALDAAGEAGGGTVYVPAGNYRFEDELIIPSGVELRGIWDVPHHIVSGGSVLMPTSGRGNAKGTPFIQLQPGSGLRGLTFWYPEQNLRREFPAYPWTVRALGPHCWLVDVTMGNSYQGVDFWTYPSTGHVIRYLAGAFIAKGLWVSKSDGDGWIEDVHINPHYADRVHPSLPKLPPFHYLGDLCAHQRQNLQAIVLGNLARQHLRGTFVYGARDFLVFRDDNGGANARVIMHGSDDGPNPLVLESVGEGGVEFINVQLHAGLSIAGVIHSKSSFQGQVSFFNSQIWGASAPTAILEGPGTVLLQQLYTVPYHGSIMVRNGHFILENAHFVRPLRPHVHLGPGVTSARIIGCHSRVGKFDITNEAGERLFARGNSASLPLLLPEPLKIGFEHPKVNEMGAVYMRNARASCRIIRTDLARSGEYALQLKGRAGKGYSFAYFNILEGSWVVHYNSVLSYWIKPLTPAGQQAGIQAGIDAEFTEGPALGDSGIAGAHPGIPRGTIGQWTEVRLPLRKVAGKTITRLMCAYDTRNGEHEFDVLFDDVALELMPGCPDCRDWKIMLSPQPPGPVPVGTAVRFITDKVIRFTLDGTNPTLESPVYEEPIVLGHPGLWDIRFQAEEDGALSHIHGALYDVQNAGRSQPGTEETKRLK